MNKDYLNFVDNTKLNKGGQKISTLSSIENMSTIELWTRAAYNMLIPPGEKSFYEVLNEENKKQFAFFAYIKSKGFMMNPSSFSFHYTFDDGERVVSSMEYDFSQFVEIDDPQ